MAATLKDVARLAGVSAKTVSNVVNGYDFVKPENRRRVEEAMAATGYRPNIGARNLRRGRTGALALILPDLSIPYFGELAAHVITAALDGEWKVFIEQTQGIREREVSALAALGAHLFDGAIVSPEAVHAEDLAELSLEIPLVLLGEHAIDVPLDRVAIDNVRAAHSVVEHLVATGRRRIAAIGGNPHRGTAAQRLAGYRAALEEAGLPGLPEYVAAVASYHRLDGARAMDGLLELPKPPDAVFCFNDLLAVGALRSAAEHGVRVPEDVAVAGFDGTDESAYCLPSLTTVAPDKAAIARAALDLLRRRHAGDTSPPEHVQVPHALEIRESSASASAPVPAPGR